MKKENNHTIDELIQEYEQIPVSPHAKERILAGIAQGKAATAVQSHSTNSDERKKKSRIIYILRNTGATTVAAMAAHVFSQREPYHCKCHGKYSYPCPFPKSLPFGPTKTRPITLKLKWMSRK